MGRIRRQPHLFLLIHSSAASHRVIAVAVARFGIVIVIDGAIRVEGAQLHVTGRGRSRGVDGFEQVRP